jgi:hypothetical protein
MPTLLHFILNSNSPKSTFIMRMMDNYYLLCTIDESQRAFKGMAKSKVCISNHTNVLIKKEYARLLVIFLAYLR